LHFSGKIINFFLRFNQQRILNPVLSKSKLHLKRCLHRFPLRQSKLKQQVSSKQMAEQTVAHSRFLWMGRSSMISRKSKSSLWHKNAKMILVKIILMCSSVSQSWHSYRLNFEHFWKFQTVLIPSQQLHFYHNYLFHSLLSTKKQFRNADLFCNSIFFWITLNFH